MDIDLIRDLVAVTDDKILFRYGGRNLWMGFANSEEATFYNSAHAIVVHLLNVVDAQGDAIEEMAGQLLAKGGL